MLTLFLFVSIAFASFQRPSFTKRVMKEATSEAGSENSLDASSENKNPYGEKDTTYDSKKYMVGFDGKDYFVYFLNKCAFGGTEGEWEKYVPYNKDYYIRYVYKNSECTGQAEEEYYPEMSYHNFKYADEIPKHVAYGEEADDKQCQKKDMTFFIYYPSECTKDGDKYIKFEVTNNKLVEVEFTDSACTQGRREYQEDAKECGTCFGMSTYELLHCEQYGEDKDGSESNIDASSENKNPYGEKDSAYASKKYLIDTDDGLNFMIYLNKCGYDSQEKKSKIVPYNKDYYIEYTYSTDDCSGEPTNQEYKKLDPESDSYSDSLPKHIAYSEFTEEEDSCEHMSELRFIHFSGECTQIRDSYYQYQITDNKLTFSEFTDDKCTKKNSGFETKSIECGSCFGDNYSEKLHCEEHPESDGARLTFVLMMVALIFFIF